MLTNRAVSPIANVLWGTRASLYDELLDWKDGPAVHNLEEFFS
jgi:hypothetical protein